jgi:hypothetical protein
VTVSTGLTRARRSQAALALDPIPASKAHSDPLEIAELDKHNYPNIFGASGWTPQSLCLSKPLLVQRSSRQEPLPFRHSAFEFAITATQSAQGDSNTALQHGTAPLQFLNRCGILRDRKSHCRTMVLLRTPFANVKKAVVRKNVIAQSNQSNSRETIAKW